MSAIDQDFVRDLIERHSDASGGNGRDFHNGAYAAIADDLNATLGDVPRLPHFWTHDGTLHIELPKLPESISVRLPDQRDREVRSARVWQYTLGDADATDARQDDAGTCKYCKGGSFDGQTVMMSNHGWQRINFCPNCGRRIEVDE